MGPLAMSESLEWQMQAGSEHWILSVGDWQDLSFGNDSLATMEW